MLGYNWLCKLSDYADPDLVRVARLVYQREAESCPTFPTSSIYRKHWEVAQGVRGLLDFGAVRPDARLLGVGAGIEATSFWLSTQVEQVFATDLYASGGWPGWADQGMLLDPTPYAPCPFNRQRLVVQHMNGCELQYPDAFFDGIYSSSSIEHFGTFDDAARSARDMGRVLKPGGVISISTEVWIGGTPSQGWGNVLLFNAETIQRCIVEPSGCIPVDPFDMSMDEPTLATVQNLDWVVATANRKEIIPSPHIVLEYQGHLFTSYSIVLRKPR